MNAAELHAFLHPSVRYMCHHCLIVRDVLSGQMWLHLCPEDGLGHRSHNVPPTTPHDLSPVRRNLEASLGRIARSWEKPA